MRRYYFHLVENTGRIQDFEGALFVDEEAALREGLRHVRHIVAHELRETGWIRLDRAIDIQSKDGEFRHTLAFSDGVSIVAST